MWQDRFGWLEEWNSHGHLPADANACYMDLDSGFEDLTGRSQKVLKVNSFAPVWKFPESMLKLQKEQFKKITKNALYLRRKLKSPVAPKLSTDSKVDPET